jgi:hypothetical protein
MSARKATSVGTLPSQVTLEGGEVSLTLAPESMVIHKSGIEFRSPRAFPSWTEMTVSLQTPQGERVRCSGVVVDCHGNKHLGYRVSMVFTGMSKLAEARLAALAFPF